jgi:hypothetical protein
VSSACAVVANSAPAKSVAPEKIITAFMNQLLPSIDYACCSIQWCQKKHRISISMPSTRKGFVTPGSKDRGPIGPLARRQL